MGSCTSIKQNIINQSLLINEDIPFFKSTYKFNHDLLYDNEISSYLDIYFIPVLKDIIIEFMDSIIRFTCCPTIQFGPNPLWDDFKKDMKWIINIDYDKLRLDSYPPYIFISVYGRHVKKTCKRLDELKFEMV